MSAHDPLNEGAPRSIRERLEPRPSDRRREDWDALMKWEDEMLEHANELAWRLDSLREPMRLAYGYAVALANHDGDTKVAATKLKSHLRAAIERLE